MNQEYDEVMFDILPKLETDASGGGMFRRRVHQFSGA
jgi:hypothetical protein